MSGEFVAIVLGLLVGLSLGALGGGGSTLAVPILVFVAGMKTQDATTASLLVVGVASMVGIVGHLRNGNVRLGAGIAFGIAGIAGSRIGTLVNRSLDENVLLLAFSAVILLVAARMARGTAAHRQPDGDDHETGTGTGTGAAADTARDGGGTLVAARVRASRPSSIELSTPVLVKLAGAATVVGVLTGLFGVGGGFAVVPALTLLLGFQPKEAVGTSLVVIAINALVALAMRSGNIGFDWALVLPFLATVAVGVVVGSAVAHRIKADSLTRSFAIMLAMVGIYTAASTFLT